MPVYLQLYGSGELNRRAQAALARLAQCDLCPRRCGVNRLAGELGACRTGRYAQVASAELHFGEESPLVGATGSGTIFFAHCNLECCFCQNEAVSRPQQAVAEMNPQQLAQTMIELQAEGAQNINLVSPTHVLAQILEALPEAVDQGLGIPLIWNSGGYDAVDALRLLEGVIDIYMPDAKFWDAQQGMRLCGVADYPQRAQEALVEMHRQVGELRIDGSGIARAGLLVRHLLLPGDVAAGPAGTAGWMDFLATQISPDTYINLMEQYRPCAEALTMPGLDRPPSGQECAAARQGARNAGLHRFDEPGSSAKRALERFLQFMDNPEA